MVSWQTLVLGTIIFTAIGSIIHKKTLFKEHAMEFSAVFTIFMAIISLFLWPYTNFDFPAHYWWLMLFLIVLSSIAFLYVSKATRHMEISESSPLFTFGPVITAVLGFIFLEESLLPRQIFGILLMFAGSYILELKSKKSIKKELLTPFKSIARSRYIRYIILALILYAVTDIIGRYMLDTENHTSIEPLTFLFILHIGIAITMFIFISIFHDGIKGIYHGIKTSWAWIALMVGILFISRLFLVYAITIPMAKIALVVALRRSSVIITTFLGGELFHEKHLMQKILAAVIMVIGILLLI
ncbi:MAG: EamA family transporter [Nanoarchaeota archaeon]|nr:EamA family transporter [Nanoarchaeota archaeon]